MGVSGPNNFPNHEISQTELNDSKYIENEKSTNPEIIKFNTDLILAIPNILLDNSTTIIAKLCVI